MLKDVVTLLAQFDADNQIDFAQRQHRDRGIGRELTALNNKPSEQIQVWLSKVAGSDANQAGDQAQNADRLIFLFSIVLGLLFGIGTALAVFYYDGSRPVNVINVLAVFVFLQILFLIGFVIACLPRSATKFIPGLASLQDALQVLNPGRLVSFIGRYLPQNKRSALRQLVTDVSKRKRVFGVLTKWMVLRWSQFFVLAFNLGAILCALYLVVFSDLAFGWSTTLKTEPASFHGLTQWLTIPWQTWLADAVPSLELVDTTRYFRLDEGLLPNVQSDSNPALLGQWWPFLLACILAYGLLPRIVTTIYSTWRLKIVTSRTLVSLPESIDLLESLNTPDVETTATAPETGGHLKTETNNAQSLKELNGRSCVVVDWSSAIKSKLSKQRIGEMCEVSVSTEFSAGGKNSLADDKNVIEQIQKSDRSMPTVIFVKAWEPPMLELIDFISELQDVDTPQRCVIIPVTFNSANQLTAPTKAQLESWHQSIYALSDQRVSIHTVLEPVE